MTTDAKLQLRELLAPHRRRVNEDLERWLIEPGTPETLAQALRYCALDVGKRLRPAMVYLAAEAVGADPDDELTRRSAVAVELVHTYSLVHDDLPAMDDDALRHGKPTVHVQYDEAMAILVGDALLTRALGLLGETNDPCSGRLVTELAAAAGGAGMIAGQVADMDLCTLPGGAEGLWYIHQRKTAALLVGAVRMGAICGGAGDVELQAVSRFARCLGLAYQITDDLLDVTGTVENLGKTPGKDARTGKRTSVSVLGLEGARQRERQLTADADEALKALGASADPLRNLAGLLVGRTF